MEILPVRSKKKNRRLGARPTSDGERTVSPWRVVLGWAAGMMALSGAAMGVVHGWEALKASSRLSVRDIVYSGNKRASVAELAAYTGIKVGDGILELDLDAVAQALARHPWVASAQVRRRLPGTLEVAVREYEPAVLVALGDIYLANDEGEVFKRMAAGDGALLPIITGLSRDEATRDTEQLRARIREGVELARTLSAMRKRAGRTDELHFDVDLGWSVLLNSLTDGHSVRLSLGKEPQSRLDTALTALEKARAAGFYPAEILADGQKHPNRVHVRLRTVEPRTSEPLIAKAR
jgi:cell division protein FtsQ